RPVKSIAIRWRFAVSIIIWSRIEPPGWMIAVTPARAATSMPSGNGKYASEPMTASRAFSPALRTATSTATTRDSCPGPIPTLMRFLEHDRVRGDVAHAPPAEDEVGELLQRRVTLGDDLEVRLVGDGLVRRLHEHAARHALVVEHAVAPAAAELR